MSKSESKFIGIFRRPRSAERNFFFQNPCEYNRAKSPIGQVGLRRRAAHPRDDQRADSLAAKVGEFGRGGKKREWPRTKQ